jgi:hypothetical protein
LIGEKTTIKEHNFLLEGTTIKIGPILSPQSSNVFNISTDGGRSKSLSAAASVV